MKVEGNPLNISMSPNGQVQAPLKAGVRSSASPLGSTQTVSDGAELGSQAGLLAAALSAGQSNVSSTVQHLRALVQSGQYQVDTAALSQSLVAAAGDGF